MLLDLITSATRFRPYEREPVDLEQDSYRRPSTLISTKGVSMLSSARQLPSLDLPINRDVAFIDIKGRYKPRLEKKQRKLLSKAAPLLKKILQPDEQILLVAPACAPYSMLEFLTTGWLIVYVKRCLLVATDRRLLHLPTRSNFTPQMSISQVLFGDAVELKVSSGLSTKLVVKYRQGKKETFSGFPRWVAKKLRMILQERHTGSAGPVASGLSAASVGSSRQYLCPQCTETLAQDSATCASCGLDFKTRNRP